MNAQHLSMDVLADAAEGLLDPERAAVAESHIARCAECRAQSDALRRSPPRCARSRQRPCQKRWLIG
jgi:anti-sigma factor RsiW